MSVFYDSMDFQTAMEFKRRKRAFKRNKPCAICGKKYPPEQMMVAHIVPVRDLTTAEALYDITNWEVRCLNCEHRANQNEHYHE